MAFINFAGKESLIVLPNAIAFLSLDNFHIKLLNLLFSFFVCATATDVDCETEKRRKKIAFRLILMSREMEIYIYTLNDWHCCARFIKAIHSLRAYSFCFCAVFNDHLNEIFI